MEYSLNRLLLRVTFFNTYHSQKFKLHYCFNIRFISDNCIKYCRPSSHQNSVLSNKSHRVKQPSVFDF